MDETGARLEARRIHKRFGALVVLDGVDFVVAPDEAVGIVGPNGAGKTTLLRALAGAHKVASGRIRFNGADVTHTPSHERAKAGVALVPEGRRLFARLSVEENLLLARAAGRPGAWDMEAVFRAFPNLQSRRHSRAGSLSGGEQQATAIGRALMTNPELLLLDEVSLGLSPLVVDRVYKQLRQLMEGGATIVLVEQDLKRALGVAHRVICMLEGRIALAGRSRELRREQVTDACFGLGRSKAKAMIAPAGFPDVAALIEAHEVADAEGYPLSKELLLLRNQRAAQDPLFKSRGVRVNAVSPGPVTTPILREFREVFGNPRVDEDIMRVGRAGSAPDIAPPALFLCSDGARWINGANLPVDGGLEASANAGVLGF